MGFYPTVSPVPPRPTDLNGSLLLCGTFSALPQVAVSNQPGSGSPDFPQATGTFAWVPTARDRTPNLSRSLYFITFFFYEMVLDDIIKQMLDELLVKLDPDHQNRKQVREFLLTNPCPDVSPEQDLRLFVERGLEWQRALWKAKILGNFVPQALGGKGGSYYDEAITLEELGLNGSPQLPGIFGITMLAPILLTRGADHLKPLVPRIFDGSELVCQLFSEPEAGSDLWNLKSTLVDRGDHYVLNGQKIWTSFAEFASMGFGLAKLSDRIQGGNSEGKKHLGVLFFIIKFTEQPPNSVVIKPIKQISGESEFCEVFFNNAVVKKDHVIGGPEDGWKVALETLQIERCLLTLARHTQTIRLIKKIVEILNANFEQEFLDLISEFNLLRISAFRHIELWRSTGSIGPYGSVDKLSWSENFKRFARLYRKIVVTSGRLDLLGEADKIYLYSIGRTIAAGTSEIQKLTVGQRILGLPKSY